MPDKIPDHMLDRMPELMPNRRSKDMRARYAGQNVKNMPDSLPIELSEDMPA